MSKAKTALTALRDAVTSTAGDDKELLGALAACFDAAHAKKANVVGAAPTADATACGTLCDEIDAACKAAPAADPAAPPVVGAVNWSELFKKVVANLPAILAIFRELFSGPTP